MESDHRPGDRGPLLLRPGEGGQLRGRKFHPQLVTGPFPDVGRQPHPGMRPTRRLAHTWRSLYDPDIAAEPESRVTWESRHSRAGSPSSP